MDKGIIGIGIAFGFSIFILYARKEKWMKPKITWLACFSLLATGLFGLLVLKTESRIDRVMYFGLCVPMIYWVFDRIFKRIIEKIHKRDFLLFLQYSDELNNILEAKGSDLKISDLIFSYSLLIIIFATTIIGMILIT